jgi:hypothetical protein
MTPVAYDNQLDTFSVTHDITVEATVKLKSLTLNQLMPSVTSVFFDNLLDTL